MRCDVFRLLHRLSIHLLLAPGRLAPYNNLSVIRMRKLLSEGPIVVQDGAVTCCNFLSERCGRLDHIEQSRIYILSSAIKAY
eukprot:scaffold12631_cov133-Skeletonema_marinoi.AAC.4